MKVACRLLLTAEKVTQSSLPPVNEGNRETLENLKKKRGGKKPYQQADGDLESTNLAKKFWYTSFLSERFCFFSFFFFFFCSLL